MNMRIEILPALKDNFIYVLISGSDCAVIDPGEAGPVRDFLRRENLRLTHILCTHHHWDHVSGIPDLVNEFRPEVWCSSHDFERVPAATKAVASHETLLGQDLRVLTVPGHTLGQIAYYIPSLEAVFPGDTLFSAGCGRLFEGTPAQMFTSMKLLRTLPAATKIYFGHEYTLRNLEFVERYGAVPATEIANYREICAQKIAQGRPTSPSTVDVEMRVNPFFNASSVEDFTKWRELRNTW